MSLIHQFSLTMIITLANYATVCSLEQSSTESRRKTKTKLSNSGNNQNSKQRHVPVTDTERGKTGETRANDLKPWSN